VGSVCSLAVSYHRITSRTACRLTMRARPSTGVRRKVTVQGTVQIDPVGVPYNACRGPSDSSARTRRSA
jgi:hypothetical protein